MARHEQIELGSGTVAEDLEVRDDLAVGGDLAVTGPVVLSGTLAAGATSLTSLSTSGVTTTSSGVGTKNGATVTAAEHGNSVIHKTTLTCAATPLGAIGDEAGQGQYGGVKVYTFPEGLINFMGATIDGAITLSTPAVDAWGGSIGLGTVAPTDKQDAANKTGSLMPKVTVTTAVAKVAVSDAESVATALTESGGRWIDGTAAAKDVYLNLLVTDNAAHDNTITGTFTGTITFAWMNLGDN